MNNIIFYYQFVYYSDEQIEQIKKIICQNMDNTFVHLISNNIFNNLYNLKNTVGKIIYIDTLIESLVNFNIISEKISILIKEFSQLNLFLIKINDLFYNISILKFLLRYMNNFEYLYSDKEYINVINFKIINNYSLFVYYKIIYSNKYNNLLNSNKIFSNLINKYFLFFYV